VGLLIADDGENYHLYVLSAPKATGGPEHRHANAVVAHAVSSDLVHWDYRGSCLETSASAGTTSRSGRVRLPVRVAGGFSIPR
jgi:sucrose-6-phosphate hydrolase SacC (GH32 family)